MRRWPQPDRPRGLHKGSLLGGKNFAPDQAGVVPPADRPDGDDDILHAAAQEPGDGHRQNDGRNGEDNIREPHDHGFRNPPK